MHYYLQKPKQLHPELQKDSFGSLDSRKFISKLFTPCLSILRFLPRSSFEQVSSRRRNSVFFCGQINFAKSFSAVVQFCLNINFQCWNYIMQLWIRLANVQRDQPRGQKNWYLCLDRAHFTFLAFFLVVHLAAPNVISVYGSFAMQIASR